MARSVKIRATGPYAASNGMQSGPCGCRVCVGIRTVMPGARTQAGPSVTGKSVSLPKGGKHAKDRLLRAGGPAGCRQPAADEQAIRR